MQCKSLALDGTDFRLSTAVAAIIAASGSNCDNSFDMDTVTLSLDHPLPSGMFGHCPVAEIAEVGHEVTYTETPDKSVSAYVDRE